MDVTKPYEFMGLGAMDVTKSYEFKGFVVGVCWGGLPRTNVELCFANFAVPETRLEVL